MTGIIKATTAEARKWEKNLEGKGGRMVSPEIRALQAKIRDLKDAVRFYAKRYHDEHHMSDSFENCSSEVCQAATKQVKS
jgi:hypothetical protein